MSFRYNEPAIAIVGFADEPVLKYLWARKPADHPAQLVLLDDLETDEDSLISVDEHSLVIRTKRCGTTLLRAGIPLFSRSFVRARQEPGSRNLRRFMEALTYWTECAPPGSLIVNRPRSSARLVSKLSHLFDLRQAGFRIPPATLSIHPRALQHGSARRISKGVSTVRTVATREFHKSLYPASENLACPALLQDFVEGYDVRVHFIGKDHFALRVDSTADDYRYARRFGQSAAYSEISVPPDIVDTCWTYMKRSRLEFAGFDFKVDGDGQYWILECNAMPGFSHFDAYHEGKIARAIYAYLAAGYSCLDWSDDSPNCIVTGDRVPTLDTGLPPA